VEGIFCDLVCFRYVPAYSGRFEIVGSRILENNVEIYRQRYETYRHLDKLRWQMLQLLIAVASAIALVLRSTQGEIEWWFYSLLGFTLLIISCVMLKIGSGIRTNSEVLREFGKKIGDNSIPDGANKWRSIAHWLALLVFALGSGLLIWSFATVLCQLGK
jgi:hypothetical protein